MIRRPPRSTLSSSSAASDVYKRQILDREGAEVAGDAFVRVAVVEDCQGPVRARLAQDALHCLLHHRDIAVVGKENVDSHWQCSFAGEKTGFDALGRLTESPESWRMCRFG